MDDKERPIFEGEIFNLPDGTGIEYDEDFGFYQRLKHPIVDVNRMEVTGIAIQIDHDVPYARKYEYTDKWSIFTKLILVNGFIKCQALSGYEQKEEV